jgi:DNA-binding NarL/FixJ family response regulator
LQGFANVRAVVVHRFPLWREALQDVLTSLEVEVVLMTDSVDKAVDFVAKTQPDLIVSGTAEELAGVECVRQARRAAPNIRAVVVGAAFDEEEADAALEAGAYAYVVETANKDDIRAAIRQGFQTSVFLGSKDPEGTPRAARRSRAKSESHGLTKREQEILKLVAEGRSNGEVARKLWVTEQTVKFHLSNIYRKLGVTNRTEAGRQAQLIGLLDDDSSTRESVSG